MLQGSRILLAGLLMVPSAPAATLLRQSRLQIYSNDGQHVSYLHAAMPEADPSTFVFISDSYSSYAKDATHVFLQDKIIPGADPATFTVFAEDHGAYGKDATHVYRGLCALPDADPRTFEVLAGGFEKDARHVYYRWSDVVTSADPRSFVVVAIDGGCKNQVVFAKDDNHVYYHGGWEQVDPSIIAGADPATFVFVGGGGYEGGFAKDSHRVYWGDQAVNGADPKTFESIAAPNESNQAPYGRDAHAVYLGPTRLMGADPKTFEVLQIFANPDGRDYAKDKHSVYYCEKRVPGADPKTFMANPDGGTPGDAKDRKHRYLGGRMLDPGPVTRAIGFLQNLPSRVLGLMTDTNGTRLGCLLALAGLTMMAIFAAVWRALETRGSREGR